MDFGVLPVWPVQCNSDEVGWEASGTLQLYLTHLSLKNIYSTTIARLTTASWAFLIIKY